jgi:hypothetical protein
MVAIDEAGRRRPQRHQSNAVIVVSPAHGNRSKCRVAASHFGR